MLQLYESASGGLDDVLWARYSQDCLYRSPLVEVRGVRHMRALFALLHALPYSIVVRRPVRVAVWDRPATQGGDAGTEVLIDQVLEIAPLPLLPRFLRFHCVSSLALDARGRVLTHTDDWRPLNSLCESFPPARRFYRGVRRLVGGLLAEGLCVAFAPPAGATARSLSSST